MIRQLTKVVMSISMLVCGLWLLVIWNEISSITRFALQELEKSEMSISSFKDCVEFSHNLAKDKNILFPIATEFTRLGKRFKSGTTSDCGDVSLLCAELGQSKGLDIRELQLLSRDCIQAKHVIVFLNDSVESQIADPLFGYHFPLTVPVNGFAIKFDSVYAHSMRIQPHEQILNYAPDCGIRFSNFSKFGWLSKLWIDEWANTQRFVIARHKQSLRLLTGLILMIFGIVVGTRKMK